MPVLAQKNLKEKKKMKCAKNKTAVAIALFLTLTIAVAIAAVVPATAQTVRTWRSFVFVGVSPNPVGVGQEVVIVAWTADMPPDIGEQVGTATSPTGRAGWYDMTVTVTRPDNTTETLKFPYTDAVGAVWIAYTPTAVGTYVLRANFPAQWKNTTSGTITHTYYEDDVSEPVELVVQDEQIQAWQEPPLPTGSWMRPINTGNRLWYPLAGNWLGGAATQWPAGSAGSSSTPNYAYGLGTETPHILWTKQYAAGGLMDERYDVTGYQTAHYQGISFSGIVLNGKLHYTPRYTHAGAQGWAIVDLYTGEQLYLNYSDNRPSFAQVYDYASGNQHGGFPYLWRTSGVQLPEIVQIPNAVSKLQYDLYPERITAVQTVNLTATSVRMGTVWEMLDGYTGATMCYIANVTSGGTAVYAKDGAILRFNIPNLGNTSHPNFYLQVWNSTHGTMPSSQNGTGAWQWRPAGGTFGGASAYLGGVAYNYVHDGEDFFSMNVSIQSALGPINTRQNQTGTIQAVREGEYVVIGTSGVNDEQGIAPGFLMAISLKDGEEGALLWKGTFTPPSSADRETVSFTGVYPEDGMFLFHKQNTIERFGYSLETFQQVWKSEPETQFHYYGRSAHYYDGMLLSYGYGGIITAYNVTTGDVLWTYAAKSEGFESTYGGNYPIGVVITSGGKLYTVTGEHSPTQPLFRGHNLRCLNATTGDEIWKIQGFFGGMSPTTSNILMADGILVGLNFFDNQLYAFGKGSSATTVTASPKTTVHGTTVVVEGTVTDQTATGRRNINDVLEFSLKGTPAISDEDQAAWMEYMFMQQAKPADAKGVEVVLSVLDPNNNCYEIGRTTSDVTGAFGFAYEPLVPGTYQIIATFEGSNAYGPSSAATFIHVMEAPTATAEPTPTPASVADLYFVPAVSGIIVAIIAVGLLLFLLLRKR